MTYLLIAVGGALGALGRYSAAGWVHTWAGDAYPWGTLLVNVVGAAMLGLFYRTAEALLVSPGTRAFVAIGFLGAFTTFSTFSYEAAALLQDGEWGAAALYSLGSVALGLVGVFFGFWLASLALRTGG